MGWPGIGSASPSLLLARFDLKFYTRVGPGCKHLVSFNIWVRFELSDEKPKARPKKEVLVVYFGDLLEQAINSPNK